MEIPEVQRKDAAPCLGDLFITSDDVASAVVNAYRSGYFTMRQIADHLGVHYSTISRGKLRSQMMDCKT